MAGITASDLSQAVRRTFNRVAERPTGSFRFGVGPALARQSGYPDAVLRTVPGAAFESFTGLAHLVPRLALRPGERALDLGCGGGLDAILMADAVTAAGAVVGVDLAEAMVARARATATALGLAHVRFAQAQAEALPFETASFDAAHVNGLLNLCPDKAAVSRELFRVLDEGGRAVIAEISFTDPRPPVEVRAVDDWFR